MEKTKIVLPRKHNGIDPQIFPNGTWIEAENFAYYYSFGRRCRAEMPDGSLRIVECQVADTYFSCPARVSMKLPGQLKRKLVRGYVSCDENGYKFTEYKKPCPPTSP